MMQDIIPSLAMLWKVSKGNMPAAKGYKTGTLYVLHVSRIDDNVINVTEQPIVSLWHSRLGHMSQKGMKVSSSLGYLPLLNFSDLSTCDHCTYGKYTQPTHKKAGVIRGDTLDLGTHRCV